MRLFFVLHKNKNLAWKILCLFIIHIFCFYGFSFPLANVTMALTAAASLGFFFRTSDMKPSSLSWSFLILPLLLSSSACSCMMRFSCLMNSTVLSSLAFSISDWCLACIAFICSSFDAFSLRRTAFSLSALDFPIRPSKRSLEALEMLNSAISCCTCFRYSASAFALY